VLVMQEETLTFLLIYQESSDVVLTLEVELLEVVLVLTGFLP
jgi:hypothetical protein